MEDDVTEVFRLVEALRLVNSMVYVFLCLFLLILVVKIDLNHYSDNIQPPKPKVASLISPLLIQSSRVE